MLILYLYGTQYSYTHFKEVISNKISNFGNNKIFSFLFSLFSTLIQINERLLYYFSIYSTEMVKVKECDKQPILYMYSIINFSCAYT